MKLERWSTVISLVLSVIALIALALQVASLLGASSELLLSLASITIAAMAGVLGNQIASAIKKLDRSQRVFLSYSSDTKEYARLITERLRQYGVKVWVDEEQLKPGAMWKDEIEQAINNSDKIIIIFGKPTNSLSYELKLAKEKSLRVIPVVVENAELPQDVKDITYIDFRSNTEEGLRRLTEAVS